MSTTNLPGYNVLVAVNVTQTGGVTRVFRWCLRDQGSYSVTGLGSYLDGPYKGSITACNESGDFGTTKEPNNVYPTFSITIARDSLDKRNGAFADEVVAIRDYDYLIGRTIVIYQVSTSDPLPAGSNKIFEGRIRRGNISISETEIRITAEDRMRSDDKKLCRAIFDESIDSNLSEEWRGKPKPVLFGDWTDEASQYTLAVPVTGRSNESGDIVCKLCVPGDDNIASMGIAARWVDSNGNFKGGDTYTYSITVLSAANRTFRLDDSDKTTVMARLEDDGFPTGAGEEWRYTWQDGDRVIIRSARGNATSGGTVIEHPAAIIQFLLTDDANGLGLASTALDAGSWTLLYLATAVYGFKARAYLSTDKSVLETIAQICFEFGFKLVARRGVYAIRNTNWDSIGAANHTIDAHEIMGWSEGADLDHHGFEGFRMRFGWKPSTEEYAHTMDVVYDEDTASDADQFEFPCDWVGTEEVAQAVAAVRLLSRTGTLRTIKIQTDFSRLDMQLGEIAEIKNHAELDGVYQITSYSIDWANPSKIDYTLINQNTPGLGGIWCGDDGETIPAKFGGGTVPVGAAFGDFSAENKKYISIWYDDDDTEDPDGNPAKIWV